jgi:hypothetical protein
VHATAVSTVATQVREHTSGKAVLFRPEGLSTIVGADLQIARVWWVACVTARSPGRRSENGTAKSRLRRNELNAHKAFASSDVR